jgi:hypothetical protein
MSNLQKQQCLKLNGTATLILILLVLATLHLLYIQLCFCRRLYSTLIILDSMQLFLVVCVNNIQKDCRLDLISFDNAQSSPRLSSNLECGNVQLKFPKISKKKEN